MSDTMANNGQTDEQKALYKQLKENLDGLEEVRREHDTYWRQIAEYCMPRRTTEILYGTERIRKRHLVDTTAMVALDRTTATITGFAMPAQTPYMKPRLIGRDPTPLEGRWLEKRQKAMHEDLRSPASKFVVASQESVMSDTGYGNSVIFSARSQKTGKPYYQALPLLQNFFSENDEGTVETNYRRFTHPLHIAAKRYPTKKLIEKLEQKNVNKQEKIDFLHAVEPREGGLIGMAGTRKPFRSVVACLTTEEIVSESGFDTFPFIITRFSKQAGQTYGEGLGAMILPLARLLNEMEETVLRAAELACDPPLVSMIGRIPRIDRRPGGMTNLSHSQLRRLDDPSKAIRELTNGGDPNIAIQLVQDIRFQIDKICFVDWLGEQLSTQPTAAEVYHKRDTRLRAMAAVQSRIELEKLHAVAERHAYLTQDSFERPPQSLNGWEMGWEYQSPLAQAQQMGVVEAYRNQIAILDQAAVHDPSVADVYDLKASAQEALVAAGALAKNIRTPEEVKAREQMRREMEARRAQLEEAQMAAAAGRDAGQMVQSVTGGQRAA